MDGTGFASNSSVMLNGTAKTTTFVSATRLTTVLYAADLMQQALFNVTVTTPGAAAASNSMEFRVGNGLPVITSLSPSSIPAGGVASVAKRPTGSSATAFEWS